MLNVQNLVSISEFRTSLSSWLEKAVGQTPVVVMQNSKPKAVVMDPEYYEYLERYASGQYDEGDTAEVRRARKEKEDSTVMPFDPSNYR